MGLSELDESSLQLDEKLLRFMDQLELLEEKRASLNALIEQVLCSCSYSATRRISYKVL